MSLEFLYRSPTTPAGAGWVEDLGTEAVRLGSIDGLTMEFELGAVGSSDLEIDDPDGTAGHDGDAIVGLKQFSINELSAPANNRRIWEGYVADRSYFRGSQGEQISLIDDSARVIRISLVDINTFLSNRVFQNKDTPGGEDASFNRPAETDVERVQALLGVSFLSTTLFDNGLVSTASPVDMDANDYESQRPADVLNDCAQQSGKNFACYYDEVANQFSLFYDFNRSDAYPSYDPDFKVSNVRTDVNMTDGVAVGPVWPPLKDGTLNRDPSRVAAGVFIPNGTNSAYKYNLDTSYAFGFRDMVSTSPNLKTQAKADARAQRYLNENNEEDDRLEFTLRLPAANVNDWKEGQWAQVKFSHLPGYSDDFVRVRCISRSVAQTEKTPEFFDVKYVCTPITIPPETFHQLVLSGRYGAGPAHAEGTYDVEWDGSGTGGISVTTPNVVQDTDGYTGSAGDMQSIANFAEWTIPAGTGGTYTVCLEQFLASGNTSWWPTIPGPSPTNPQQVPYVTTGTGAGCGAEIGGGGATVKWSVMRKRGAGAWTEVASVSVTKGGGTGYWSPVARLAPATITVEDGDLMKVQITFSGGNLFDAMYKAYGLTVYGDQQGFMILTRTGD